MKSYNHSSSSPKKWNATFVYFRVSSLASCSFLCWFEEGQCLACLGGFYGLQHLLVCQNPSDDDGVLVVVSDT